jgi:glucan-binding YG repeat protein
MIKKLVCSLLIVASVVTVMPIGVSAEWKQNSAGWWYSEGSSYYTDWKQIDGSWYNFGKDGYMRRGWIKDGQWWYYLQDNGVMSTGEILIKGKQYNFDNSGRWLLSSISNQTATPKVSAPPSQDKLKITPKFTWFYENGNTYFKTNNNGYLKGEWQINQSIYVFDLNGVLQKGEYTTSDGKKFLLGYDGKFIKCISDSNFTLRTGFAIETKSTSDNSVVKLDDSNMMTITSVYSNDAAKNGINSEGVKVEGKTLYCKTNQNIKLGNIKVIGTDPEITSFPSLEIKTQRSDKNVAFSSVNLRMEDSFYKNIQTEIFAHNPGRTTITIDVNGTKTSFDVVVTE